jgi:hypothetical protein
LKRKREDPDLQLLVAEEIAKRGGGGGCLECRKNLTQVNETLRETLVLAKAHMNLLRGKLELDRMYQNEFAIHTRVINTQQEFVELMEASVVDLKKTILAQNKFITRKHGREHTGRRRGRPKKLVKLDGKPIVPAKAVDSEEEEEEE